MNPTLPADTTARSIAAKRTRANAAATADPPASGAAIGDPVEADAFHSVFQRLRARHTAARPPRDVGPTPERPLAARINGLCWSVVGDAEPRVLHALRRDLAARLGGPDGLERHYADGERVGHITHVRDQGDVDWLRLRVALLAERAGLRAGVLRVVAGDREAP